MENAFLQLINFCQHLLSTFQLHINNMNAQEIVRQQQHKQRVNPSQRQNNISSKDSETDSIHHSPATSLLDIGLMLHHRHENTLGSSSSSCNDEPALLKSPPTETSTIHNPQVIHILLPDILHDLSLDSPSSMEILYSSADVVEGYQEETPCVGRVLSSLGGGNFVCGDSKRSVGSSDSMHNSRWDSNESTPESSQVAAAAAAASLLRPMNRSHGHRRHHHHHHHHHDHLDAAPKMPRKKASFFLTAQTQ